MNANVIEVKPFNITKIELVALRGPKGETGYPTPEEIQTAVDAWLEDHPEATTTVQDGAITTAKLHDGAVTEDKLSESLQSLLITDTASGSIASFTDGSDGINVRDLSVNVEPSQDLHGYSNPWPAGGGKNKLQFNLQNMKTNNSSGSWSGNVYTQSGVTFTVNDDGTVKVNGTASALINFSYYKEYSNCPFNGYILNGCPSGGSNTTYEMRISDVDSRSNAEFGNGIEINLSSTGKWQVMIFIRSRATLNNAVFSPMIRASLESATYAPYSNICPITGWDNVKVTRTGKNLANGTFGNQVPSISNGQMVSANGWSTPFIKIDNAKEYTFSFSGSAGRYVLFYDSTQIYLGSATNIPNGYHLSSYANYSQAEYIKLRSDAGSGQNPQLQLELGTIASDYEPSAAASVTIPLGSTVYGGTLDVSTGVLTVDRATVSATTLTGLVEANGFRIDTSALVATGSASSYGDLICNMFQRATSYAQAINQAGSSTNGNRIGYNAVGQFLLNAWVNGAKVSTIEALNALLPQEGLQVTYPLANPTTVQLTAQQMTTLLGQNNIFADAGNVDVTYVADTKLYIAKMIANALNA